METALFLLGLQGILGAFDTLYYHEFHLRLYSTISARKELKLHAARDFLYTAIFASLAWGRWEGFWAWVLIGFLAMEIIITLWDFIEEDRSRKVPPGERSMHAIMGLVYGAFLAISLPELFHWSHLPTRIGAQDYGLLSWLLSLMAVGVCLSGLRDVIAASVTASSRSFA